MKKVKIGNRTCESGVFLAPMAGFTDRIFRDICRSWGADYTVSEMISAAAIHYGDKKTAALAYLPEGDTPTAIQIFGHSPEFMAEAAGKLVRGELTDGGERCAAIDINMGCPVKKIVGGGDGSALMKSPELCARIVDAVASEVTPLGVPVTVKLRLGFEEVNAPEVAGACVSAGAAAVFVHGRTRSQMYAGKASLDGIARVREAVDPAVPVIGNGDITCREDAVRMMEETGCDGVMIGRAALSDPWIFRAIADPDFVPPDEAQRRATALYLIERLCGLYGEEQGICAGRCRAGYLIAGVRGAAAVRRAINSARTLGEVRTALE